MHNFRSLLFSSFLLSMVFIACQEKPAGLEALQNSPVALTLPSSEPEEWLMAHIDVETTGLMPGYHEMIDIGIVMTTLDGALIDSLFLHIQPDHPERLEPGAFAVNAFDAEKWRSLGALSIPEAVDRIISFHQAVAGRKNVLMVSHNCQFDTAFLDHLFRKANRNWRELYHYYVLDIPSMAWGLGFRDLTTKTLMQQYGIVDEPHVAEDHTGITGAMKNVRVYQALLAHAQLLSAQGNQAWSMR